MLYANYQTWNLHHEKQKITVSWYLSSQQKSSREVFRICRHVQNQRSAGLSICQKRQKATWVKINEQIIRRRARILEAFEKGKLKQSEKAADTQKRHQAYAEVMSRKDARIDIRLPSKDLRGLQKRASWIGSRTFATYKRD